MTAHDLRAFIAEPRLRLACGDFHDQRELWPGNEITLTDVEFAVQAVHVEVETFASLSRDGPEQVS